MDKKSTKYKKYAVQHPGIYRRTVNEKTWNGKQENKGNGHFY